VSRALNPQECDGSFRLAVETCRSGMVVADATGTIQMVNRSAERMFGYEPGALLGQLIDVFVPDRLRPLHMGCAADELHARAETSLTNVTENLLGRRMDASEFPIEMIVNPTEVGGALLVFNLVADSSKQRAAEKHLEQMEIRYQGLLEAAPDAMVVVNASGEIVLLNIQAEKRFGYRRDELLGQKVTNIIPEGFAERLVADALRSTEDALAQQIGTGLELSGLRKDGSEFPIEIMLSPLVSTEGFLVTAAIRDITTRRNMERLKDEFVSTVSHELRTPLTSIAGALGLLAGEAAGKLPDAAARLVAIASANSQRLARLINDILDIEKLEFGKVVFRLKRLDVRTLVEQSIDANRGFAEKYGVRVRLVEGSDSCIVRVDADRLFQVVTNLLSNAVKFSPVGEEVTVTVEALGDTIRIAVRDHGPGIPSDFKLHVFDKFAQADATDARQKGGTGLGLSIAKQITVRLGGTVGFDDAPGGGTIFHVELPSVDHIHALGFAREDAPGAELLPALVGNPERSFRRSTILHVDDDADVLRLLAAMMGPSVDVVSVESLSEARQEIKTRRIDLAVLDLALGAESGLDLLPDLFDLDHHEIPIIVFSARCAGLSLDPRIKAAFDKSQTSLEALLATVRGQLAPRWVNATRESA
jgi:PAS domain S-box-containing protein